MDNLAILLLSLLLDAVLGEVKNSLHPVAWLGKLISLQLKFSPQKGIVSQFIFGIIIVLATSVVITVPLYCLLLYLHSFNALLYILLSAYVLKATFSVRGLWQSVNAVKTHIAEGDIDSARTTVRALVSRNTATLDSRQVISASIESCAENTCDSFVAPLFYFAIFGLPGALVYRIINTFDSMIGYHGQWEYIGKFSARVDDLANFIPARISALLIIVASGIIRKNIKNAWQTTQQYHTATESPNAGWTMSAMAGSLGIQLEKPEHYRLGHNSRELTCALISESQEVLLLTASIWTVLIVTKEVICLVAT
ncbi:MAG: cobalamin biosynthesis protein [Dehalococcoidia bacterium]|nr:cobalamin biosynthesis protein [Dehalococcoidia bacterium]MDD5493124.1 cobalamin biosynthesis protein [Dehalococcoidia bacterium]